MSSSAAVSAAVGPRARAPLRAAANRPIAVWLFVCCALVFAMVVVGGVTRLTHSGLSIVEWQPIVGTLPPLTEVQWQETFAKYRLTPEFRLRNHDMTLAGFKEIFWWEYFHRLLGRLIGLAFIVPFAWFLAARVAAVTALQTVGVVLIVANAVLFLVSERSRQMTGKEVTVDGGWDV